MEIINLFKYQNSYKKTLVILLFSISISLVCHNLYFINGYTNPDGIIEGLTYFTNTTWIIEGCGRWLLAILTYLSGNLVMPFLSVIGYSILVGLSSIILSKTIDDDSYLFPLIYSALVISAPACVVTFNYNAVAFAYAIAILLTTVFVYCVFNNKKLLSKLIAVSSVTCILGIYQSYISYCAFLVLFVFVIKLLKNNDLKTLLFKLLECLIFAIIGSILYLIAFKLIITITHLQSSSRMANISASSILSNLFTNIKLAYVEYLNYFNDSILFRKYFYIILFILFTISLIFNLYKKDTKTIIIILFATILMPLANNVVVLIIPSQENNLCMSHQYVLSIVYLIELILLIYKKSKFTNLLKYTTILFSIVLCWTYIISANATYTCYKLSYEHTYNQMSQIVYDIEHHNDYVLDETPIIIAGFVDDDTLRKEIKTYNYAVGLSDNLVFWNIPIGTTYNRQKYFLNYFGLDFKDINYADYQEVVNSEEFKEMNIWPKDGSIKMINGYLVVKLEENPLGQD